MQAHTPSVTHACSTYNLFVSSMISFRKTFLNLSSYSLPSSLPLIQFLSFSLLHLILFSGPCIPFYPFPFSLLLFYRFSSLLHRSLSSPSSSSQSYLIFPECLILIPLTSSSSFFSSRPLNPSLSHRVPLSFLRSSCATQSPS